MEIGRWIARAVAARLRCVRRGGRHPAAAAACTYRPPQWLAAAHSRFVPHGRGCDGIDHPCKSMADMMALAAGGWCGQVLARQKGMMDGSWMDAVTTERELLVLARKYHHSHVLLPHRLPPCPWWPMPGCKLDRGNVFPELSKTQWLQHVKDLKGPLHWIRKTLRGSQ